MALRRGGDPPDDASRAAPGDGSDNSDNRRDDDGPRTGGGEPSFPGVGSDQPDSGSSTPDRGDGGGDDFTDRMEDRNRDPVADDSDSSSSSGSGGGSSGSNPKGSDTEDGGPKQSIGDPNKQDVNPTDPDSPGGTTVGSQEVERYLREAALENRTVSLDENGALKTQVERATGVDVRKYDDRGSVEFDGEENEVVVRSEERRREAEESAANSEGVSRETANAANRGAFGSGEQGTATNERAPQGGDVRLLTLSQDRPAPEGGDVRLRREAARQRGVEGGDVRLRETADDDRRPVQQERVSSLVSTFEEETGVDVPGEGRVTEPTRGGEQFGDFEGGALGAIDRGAEQLADGAFSTVDRVFSDQNRQQAESLDRVPQIPGAPVLTVGGFASGRTGDFAEGSVQGAAAVTAGAPQTVVEASEFVVGGATGEFDAGDVAQGATNRAVQTGEAAATNPSQFGGALAGSTIASVGAIGAANRVAGAGAGRAVSTAIQPGEEAAAAAARVGLISNRAARTVPGVRNPSTRLGANAETSRTSATARSIRRTARETQSRLGAVRERAPDVTVTRDADAGLVEVDPLLGQQVRNAVSTRTPSRPSVGGDGLRVEAARLRRGVSEARRDARAEVRRRASSVAPDRDSLTPDADVPAALQDPVGTVQQATARARRTGSEAVRDIRAESRLRASQATPGGESLRLGDGLRLEAARFRRNLSEARRDVRAETRRRASELFDRDASDITLGASSTRTSDVFGRPQRTSEAVDGLRSRFGGRSTPTLGESSTRTADVFGRPERTGEAVSGVSERLRGSADRIRSLGTDGVTTPSLPRPGELTVRIGPSRPARVDVGDVNGNDIGYDLEADVPDQFRPGENIQQGDAPTAGSSGAQIGGSVDVGGGQRAQFRTDSDAGAETQLVDDGPLASRRRSAREDGRAFVRGEPESPTAPSETPAVTQPELSGVATGTDVGGTFEGDAVGTPRVSTDVELDSGRELEPGRETRVEPRGDFNFRSEVSTETEPRPETTTEFEQPTELRTETNPEPRPETPRERAGRLSPRPNADGDGAFIDDGGDEGRFEFQTRRLL